MAAIFFLLVLCAMIGCLVYYSIRYGIAPMPSSKKAQEGIFTLINDVHGDILELGSGWGSLAFPLADRFPHCQVIAYEISPIPWLFSTLRLTLFPRPNLKIERKNFFHASFKNASLVFCYLYPGAMHQLKLKFKEELPSGALVISNTFALPGWEPEQILTLGDLYHTKIYKYKIKEGIH